MLQRDLFLAFFRVGMLGYGGGPSSIPLVYKEVVDKYGWMSAEEFSDTLCIGNTLPGPIATKMAGYVGYRVGGWLGMINAVLATTIPTMALMIILLTSLASVKHLPWVDGMTRGVVPVIAVMLGVLTWDFVQRSQKTLGLTATLILLVISFIFTQTLGLHPALIIGALILFALLKPAPKPQEPVSCADEGGKPK
jgi:chromate transporter